MARPSSSRIAILNGRTDGQFDTAIAAPAHPDGFDLNAETLSPRWGGWNVLVVEDRSGAHIVLTQESTAIAGKLEAAGVSELTTGIMMRHGTS
jgi:hypothetical protein